MSDSNEILIKLSSIQSDINTCNKNIEKVERELSEIKSIVTLTDLQEIKNDRLEIVRMNERIDNLTKEIKKDVKPVAMISGLSGSGIIALIMAIIDYFSKR